MSTDSKVSLSRAEQSADQMSNAPESLVDARQAENRPTARSRRERVRVVELTSRSVGDARWSASVSTRLTWFFSLTSRTRGHRLRHQCCVLQGCKVDQRYLAMLGSRHAGCPLNSPFEQMVGRTGL